MTMANERTLHDYAIQKESTIYCLVTSHHLGLKSGDIIPKKDTKRLIVDGKEQGESVETELIKQELKKVNAGVIFPAIPSFIAVAVILSFTGYKKRVTALM